MIALYKTVKNQNARLCYVWLEVILCKRVSFLQGTKFSRILRYIAEEYADPEICGRSPMGSMHVEKSIRKKGIVNKIHQ